MHEAEARRTAMRGKINPRQANGRQRQKAAKRFAAMNAPCALCHGRRGDIHYNEPRSHLFPLSLVIDEIKPVSRWREFGYTSAEACASDPNNWQPAHYVCNSEAGDKRKPKRIDIKRDANSGTF